MLRERGPTASRRTSCPNVLVDSASGQLAISLGIRGPNYAVVSACATGSHAIGEARGADQARRRRRRARRRHRGVHASADPRRLLRDARARGRGRASAARVAAVRRDARRVRDGRGRLRAAARGLERARARGAQIYAEVLGYGASNDAHHMAQPEPEAIGVAEMMRAALRRADVEPERVGYINAHGTSTPLGDAGRDEGDQGRLRRPRVRARRLVDEVDDGPLLRRGRRDRGDDVRPRAARRASSRRRSTTSIPIPTATSTTCRTRRARRRSTSRSRTRWASAATTAACCSGGSSELHRRAERRGVRGGAHHAERRAVRPPRRGDAGEDDDPADDGRPDRGPVPRVPRPHDRRRAACSSSARSPATRRSRWRAGCRRSGRIITCDVNEETTAIARRYAEEAGRRRPDRVPARPGARHDRRSSTARSTSSSSTPTRRTTSTTTRRCCRSSPTTG